MHLEKYSANKRISVPILLPTGRDAELVSSVLNQNQIDVVVCASMNEMLDQVRSGCGPFLVGTEAFSEDAAYRLIDTLNTQPEWSDVPGIVFTGRSVRQRALELLSARREISLIQRPIKKSLFTTMIQTAIEARLRQYQVKELLDNLIRSNEKLNSHTALLQKLALEITQIEDRERQRIAQILHDDLQQMLASAKLQIEILYDHLRGQPLQKAEMIHDIVSEAMKTSRSLSHELNPTFIHGENLGTAIKKLGNRIAENTGFEVHITIEADTDQIADDIKAFIYRSIQELLLNCSKHAEASRVSIELTNQGGFLSSTMTDDGVGIDQDELKINGGNEGGIGLYSIQQRALALGGSFEAISLPDKGSRFVLKVPLGSENEAGTAAKSEKTSTVEDLENDENGKSDVITVVIADDHAVMRQGLASLLHDQPNIEVVAEAENGEEAVALALHFRPAVVLMDFAMPRLDGIQATRRIRKEAPNIVVIGLSMYSAPDTRKKMLDAGAQTYLTKDVQAKELIDTIKKHVSVD